MKNFFSKKTTCVNPFAKKDGDDETVMTEEIKEQEQNIVEENTEKSEEIVEQATEEQQVVAEDKDNNELEKIKADFDNLNNQYLRLAADFDNYRKRQASEREALLKYGAQECMKKVIELVDNFDRAIKAVETIDNVDQMKETFFVLHKQLLESMTKLGLEQIKCVGEKFDPNLHEAVMQTQTEDVEEDTVVTELQKGYKLGDKVLRPSMVAVAVK